MHPQTRTGPQGLVAARPGLQRHTRPRKQERALRFGKGAPLPCRQRTRTSRPDGFGLSLAARVAKQTGRTILFLAGNAGGQARAKGEVGTEVTLPQFKCGMSGLAALPVRPRRGAAGGAFAIISKSWREIILLET